MTELLAHTDAYLKEFEATVVTVNLEGRYPDLLIPPPSQNETENYMRRAKEVYEWLMSQL